MKTEAIKSTMLDLSDGKVVGFRLQGRLEKADYDRIIPLLESKIERFGKIRVLLEIKELRGITPAALWEDLKFDVRHAKDVERLAVVGDTDWQEWMAKISQPLIAGEARFFEFADLRDAWTWLKAE